MIGKIMIGKSFRGCISYCLEDKAKMENEKLVTNRAEVICYNLCYGNKQELVKQFNDVRGLNPNLSKPVMHITLSFPPGEQVDKATLQAMIEDCAKELGFENNQYVAIRHCDTNHRHIHIVVNRVGFDGKTVKDNHNYQRMAGYCRKTELKYKLQQVLSPKRYLPKELRRQPRLDLRKEQLKKDIGQCLNKARNYSEFEQLIWQKRYKVEKGRGIAFIDRKGVRVKGSEVGFSLAKIEKILSLPVIEKGTLLNEQLTPRRQVPSHKNDENTALEKTENISSIKIDLSSFNKNDQDSINPGLIKKKRQRKRRLRL